MSDYNDALKIALATARGKRSGTLHEIVRSRGISLNNKGYASECPWCRKKGTLKIEERREGTGFKCFNDTCAGNTGGDEVGFFMLEDGMDLRSATRAYLEHAGVEHPWDEFQREKAKDKPTPKTRPTFTVVENEPEEPEEDPEPEDDNDSDNGDTPQFINLPEEGKRNPHEEIWARLELTSKHRMEIKKKRGLDQPWIDALGFRSSLRSNREILSELIELFPPNQLLESSLFVRKKGSQDITPAHALCGMGLMKDPDGGDPKPSFKAEPIIIPYISADGRITDLRPHKTNLTNKIYLQEENMEFSWKGSKSLIHPYCEALLTNRPEEFKNTCVIAEGEMKAAALRRVGIPAIGFTGISSLKNENFLQETVKMLSNQGIKEVVVVFDNEDKSHKQLKHRFEAEKYARYTALMLERYQFRTRFGILPDAWQIDGKADWDGALAELFIAPNRVYATGIKKAKLAFKVVIDDAKPISQQFELWKGTKETIIASGLKRLLHEPNLFTGGSKEQDEAAEITRWCDPYFAELLNAEEVCKSLRSTYGSYYLKQPMSAKERPRYMKYKQEINEALEKTDDETTIRRLKAARRLVNIILYRRPKVVTDFTMISRYKLRTPDGKEDRLVQFIDTHGVRSKTVYQLTGKRMATATQFREFCYESGSYHWKAGQTEIDFLTENLDIDNYQKVIHAIDVVGYQKESKIYIVGDCAIAPGGIFIFPDRDGIIWWKDKGYRYSDEYAEHLIQRPPMLWPGLEKPREALANMDWEKERNEVCKILERAMIDYSASFGDSSYMLSLGMTYQYLAQPEVYAEIGGKPGLWAQGRKGSGKTETMTFNMRMLGFTSDYGRATVTGTKIGLERGFAQYCGLPVHIDEWRNNEVPNNAVAIVRNAYNEQGQPKGMADGSQRTRVVRPLTMPIITGEDACTDAATMSRFVKVVMAESRREGTPKEQRERFARMQDDSEEYYRIGRYLFYRREEFAKLVVEGVKHFISDPAVIQSVPTARTRQVYASAWAGMNAAYKLIFEGKKNPDLTKWIPEFARHAKVAADDTEREVFIVKFFDDCVTMINRGVPHISTYLKVVHGHFINHRFVETGPYDEDAKRYVMIAARELYDEYERDKQSRKSEIPLQRHSLQLELRREPYWVEAHSSLKPKAHRVKLNGDSVRRVWWILDFDKMEDLKEVFDPLLINSEQGEITL